MLMPDWLTWSLAKDVVLALLAAYGAILSTLNWRQARDKERRQVKVALSTVVPAYADGNLGGSFARIEVTNVGHRAVTIKTVALELPGGARMFRGMGRPFPGIRDPDLPVSLADGQSASFHLAYADIGEALIASGRSSITKIAPVCEDTADNEYRGKEWPVNPAEFSRM